MTKPFDTKADNFDPWYSQGLVLVELGRYEEAIASCDQALKLQPSYVDAWVVRGVSLFRLGRYEEAIASYDQALKFQPNSFSHWSNRGALLAILERYEEAIASYDQALTLQPNSSLVWSNRGLALFALGRYEEAIANYDQALALEPNDPKTCYSRGITLDQLKRYQEAIASYDQALKLQPSYADVWDGQGIALSKLGRYEEAIASYDQALKFQPYNSKVWNGRGLVLSNLERYEEALDSYDQALKFQPNHADAWYNQGVALIHLERYEEAIASYDQALKFQPNHSGTWVFRGVALFRLERYEEAIASYDQALTLQPDYPLAWINRGDALTKLKRYDEALNSCDQALTLQSDYPLAWINRGDALTKLKRYDEALNSCDQALTLQPDYPLALYGRGVVLCGLGRYEEALSTYERALEVQPDYASSLNGRGNVLYALERYEEALDSYDRVLTLQSNDSLVWNNRGLALSNLGRYQEAIASYDQALSLQPNSPSVWYCRGIALLDVKWHEEAIASYDQALAFQPNYSDAWFGRGVALSRSGRKEEAIASYDQALSLQPNKTEAWVNRGVALSAIGRYEEAIASYDQALSLQPNKTEAWVNRGNAARVSPAHVPSCQQQFAFLFAASANDRDRILHRSFPALPPEQHLAALQQSFLSSQVLLRHTLAPLDAPALQALLQQPSTLEFAALIKQPVPAQLFDLLQQPLSDTVFAAIQQDSLAHPSLSNPLLNQRGYEGQLASYRAELGRTIRLDTNLEGWSVLHHAIGQAQYQRGREAATPTSFWREAVASFNTALQPLEPPICETLHLEALYFDILQDLLKVLNALHETEEAQELQRRGTALLHRLLADPQRSETQKRNLALNAARFNQLTVDLALQSGDPTQALQLAEIGKNTCLRWLLGVGEVPEVSYEQMQGLLASDTAAIYWHLSPAALTTFVLLPGADAPIPIPPPAEQPAAYTPAPVLNSEQPDQRSTTLKQLLAWEQWLQEWHQQYQSYSTPKDKTSLSAQEKQNHSWRIGMKQRLEDLAAIFNISAISDLLKQHSIQQLLLIPHRGLHCFPLHIYFDEFTCTYLPSAHLGLLRQQQVYFGSQMQRLLLIENPRSIAQVGTKKQELSKLPFAEVEAELVRQCFSDVTPLANEAVTLDAVQKQLARPHQVLHCNGHGWYNGSSPAQSCLFLSGNDQLTLTDIVRVDLSSYRLVCLAACETAVSGEQTITDEYVGLSSAFLKAGAACVVSTLWTVESAASAVLVVQFYAALRVGQSPAKALQTAQRFFRIANRERLINWMDIVAPQLPKALNLVIQQEQERIEASTIEHPYNHPYYWAAFTVTGL